MTVPIVAKLRSFHRRRIRVPVEEHALVLDVGSGDKPSWRADVLLDGYPDDPHAGQRSGTGRTRVDRALFDADAAAMPFADGAFDYVICSHVLEHVPDPSAVIAELTRVARAGYIEVPEAAPRQADRLPHPPVVVPAGPDRRNADAGVHRQDAPYFDAEIDDYLRRTGLEPSARPACSSRASSTTSSSCGGRGTCRTASRARLDPDFVRRTFTADAPHHGAHRRWRTALTRVLVPRGHRPRRSATTTW